MTISIALVKELREQTGAGMMECKKALEESQGNLEAAITLMRKSGQAKAAKKGSRVAAEGVVAIKISTDHKEAIILEVNCETDFAARDKSFLEFVDLVAQTGLQKHVLNLEQLLAASLDNGQTILNAREDLVAKIGENITLRRMKLLKAAGTGLINSYVHGNGRIGVLVSLSSDNLELGKDIAMHIAATKPEGIVPTDIPQALIDKEKEIYLAQLSASGKPAEILEKIVAGKIQKFVSESVLVQQPFIKNPDIAVGELLKQANANVTEFVRFEVGEGIEKKSVDFATEVQAQVAATQKS